MKYFAIAIAAATIVSCTTGRCRDQEKKNESAAQTNAVPSGEIAATQPGAAAAKPLATVKVFKYDGSKQCGQAAGQDVAAMEKQLKGVTVISRDKANDGKMRIQMCGADTGQANVYEIRAADLKAAEKAGFKEWKF